MIDGRVYKVELELRQRFLHCSYESFYVLLLSLFIVLLSNELVHGIVSVSINL